MTTDETTRKRGRPRAAGGHGAVRAPAVVRAGAPTTVQDDGRPGHAPLGVPGSGALDRPAAALVNRLVGNAPGTAVLETTATGCAVRGVRTYVAFGGGVAVAPVRGSRSTDLLSGLGPPPLTAGAVLPLGPPPPAELVPPVRPGPRYDWFTPAALRTLTTRAYRVASASDRIGLRTEGPSLERAVPRGLPSEGAVLGAVQVPPDGLPVVFLADRPTTGGRPVVAVAAGAAPAAAAQAVPGTPVRFVAAGAGRPAPGSS